MTKITKDTLIGEIVKLSPDTAEIMFDYGLHCIGCCGSAMESLEDGAKMHGLSDEKIAEMVKKINDTINGN